MQRDSANLPVGPRGGDACLSAETRELERQRQIDFLIGANDDDGADGVRKSAERRDHEVGADGRGFELVAPFGAGLDDDFTTGRHVAQDDARAGKHGAGRVRYDTGDGGGVGG